MYGSEKVKSNYCTIMRKTINSYYWIYNVVISLNDDYYYN